MFMTGTAAIFYCYTIDQVLSFWAALRGRMWKLDEKWVSDVSILFTAFERDHMKKSKKSTFRLEKAEDI